MVVAETANNVTGATTVDIFKNSLQNKLEHLVIKMVVVIFSLDKYCNMIWSIVSGCTTMKLIFQSS